jgi:phosphoadenosine phosphosulfate reductase
MHADLNVEHFEMKSLHQLPLISTACAPMISTPCDSLAPAPNARPPKKIHADLKQQLQSVSAELESATAIQRLEWAIERFGNRFGFATAFGAEGMVVIHLLAQIDPSAYVFNLDTGYQFKETLEMRDRVSQRYGIEVKLERPETTVEQYEAINGGPVHIKDPVRCCRDRKVAVLNRIVGSLDAWASAIRRDQSSFRANAPVVGWDEKFELVKVSPLVDWSKKDIWKFIFDHNVPYNPLHDQGYPSIGCAPCTHAVTLGSDDRSGRWSGSSKTECGLHADD